jgi:3-oxoacyl-[acyl-carrier-protein] synthase II
MRAISVALADAQISIADVGYVNAHGTSTIIGDLVEAQAIRSVFGKKEVPVSSVKSMTGHMLGATGGVEAIFAIKALQEGLIPPTINLDNPDPECDLDYVPNIARKKEINTAMSNTFGFGGVNAALVFKKYRQL